MNAVDQILAEARKLPEADRAEIAGRLLRDLDHDREEKDPGYDEAWAAEIEARAKAVEEGRVDLIDADTILDRLRQRLKRAAESSPIEDKDR